MILPRRVFQSPLIRYANFKGGSRINLIRLIKPYADGRSYAIYSTSLGVKSKMFSKYENALRAFNDAVNSVKNNEEMISSGVTGNAEIY